MASAIVAMKLRMMWAGIRRETWKISVFIIFALYFSSLYFGLHLLAAGAGSSGYTEQLGAASVIGAVIVLIGWILAPIVGYGFDDSLDPRRFAPFIAASDALGHALVLATIFGFGGLITLLLLFLPVTGWIAAGQWIPALLAVAVIPLTLYLCALIGRLCATSAGHALVSSNKMRDRTSLITTVAFVLIIGPLGIYMSVLTRFISSESLMTAAHFLVWTPLAGPVSLPWLVDSEQWGAVVIQVIYTVILIAGLLKLWTRTIQPAMVGHSHPVSEQAQRAIDEGRHLIDETAAEAIDPAVPYDVANDLRTINLWRKLGCAPPTAAVAARTAREWIKDPRLSSSLAALLIFPVIAFAAPRLAGGNELATQGSAMEWVMIFIPLLLGFTCGVHVSYDSTAFWMHVSSGISGKHDRWGRFLGSLPVSIPLLLGVGAVTGYFSNSLSPAAWIVILCAVFFIATGLSSTFTGYFSIGAQPPGTNPLSSKGTGNIFASMLVMSALGIGTMVLTAPIAIPYLIWTTAAAEVVISVAALVWSVIVLVVGLAIGARVFDRGQVHLLKLIRSWPGH